MSRTIISTADETPKRLRVYAISFSNLVHIFIPFFAAPSSPFLWEFQDITREEIRWMRWRKKRETYSNDQMLRQHSTKGNDKIGNVEINLMKTFFIDLMDFFSLSFRVGNGCLKGLAGKFQMSNVAKKRKGLDTKQITKEGSEWVWALNSFQKVFTRGENQIESNFSIILTRFLIFLRLFAILLYANFFFPIKRLIVPQALLLHCSKLSLLLGLNYDDLSDSKRNMSFTLIFLSVSLTST